MQDEHYDALLPLIDDEEPKKIKDPWHSRLLDVHRWSDHPEIVSVVNSIWEANFKGWDEEGRSGPKPKQNFRYQLRVLILDLYVAWTEDPTLSIAVSMSQNDYHTGSRYNALRISKKIIPLIQGLTKAGLIDMAKGSYSGPFVGSNRTTRIRAAQPLQELFRSAKLTRDDIGQADGQECIILKAGEGDDAQPIEYEDIPSTLSMRQELTAYNALLADTFIDLPTLEDPWVIRDDGRGRTVRVQIDHHHQFVRRIFSRGDWGLNGRFYGPWWQQIGSDLRSLVFINDTPTVEVDYKGLHVAILSAEKGVEIEGDPYALPEGVVPGTAPDLQRVIVKKLVLTALNARTRNAAFASFREGFEAGHMAKGLKNEELDRVLDAFTTRHPHLADALCTDQGIRLMNVDSRLAEIVLRMFTQKGIPVLSVHDSFIIDFTRVGALKKAMHLAAEQVVGKPLTLEANGQGLDEFTAPHHVKLDLRTWRETPRCEGYLSRMTKWEDLKGKEVKPYR